MKGTQWLLNLILLLAGAFWLHHDERKQLVEEIDLRARGYVSGHVALADWIRDERTPSLRLIIDLIQSLSEIQRCIECILHSLLMWWGISHE